MSTRFLVLFLLSLASCVTVEDSFEEVFQFVAEKSHFHFSADNDRLIQISDPSLALVSHSQHMQISSISGIESIEFFYKSRNSLSQNDFSYISELGKYSQNGIHLLVEHNSETKPKNLGQIVDELLAFSLFGAGPCESLLQGEGAQIRSKEWILGDQTPNNLTSVEYFYKFLSEDVHQYVSQRRAILRAQKSSAFSLASPFESDLIQSLHSLSFKLNRISSSLNYDLTVQENTVTALSEDFSFHAGSATVNALHSCINGECVLSSSNQGSNGVTNTPVKLQSEFGTVISFERTVQGDGFHKDLKTNIVINLNDKTRQEQECQVLLVERMSEDFFVDQYQVDERFKFGSPSQVLLDHTIDLEKPSYQSTANVVLVKQTTRPTPSGIITVEFELPFHYRYKMPESAQLYVTGTIPAPSVFIKCASEIWETIPVHETKEIVIQLPTGQIEHSSFVINSTLIITTIGALLVLFTIIKSRNK